ncbi:ATP-binding protein [Desulfosporosinus youngiae]|uniref:4Fe-4S protein n=1 Tax=Desulfosporosinus youngiae DSM 17734 TaxID=768710 RepID=H5XZ62_9FIRM|nr:4Fe-4S binding protein [Desulfosporosinus youngiae]EHQ91768.1 4Fe-4S protein [Desulfosporosinus youngiae DSM 17734]
MTTIDNSISSFGVPEFAIPYLSRFISEYEMDLVDRLDGQKCTAPEIAVRLGFSLEETQVFLQSCYNKHIVHKEELNGELVYFAGDFYDLLDYMCKFDENYPLMDKELKQALDQWCYQVYAERMEPYLNSLLNGEAVDRAPEEFMLIEDLDDVLERVSEIRLVPCNCRKLAEQCAKPVETCLSFDDAIKDRTFGRSLTREEAKELVMTAHKKGLMHQLNSDWRTNGPAFMCNCCSCCCYPTRLAQEKGTKGIFPISQFEAHYDETKCSHCGACTKRCNFGAFYWGETERVVKGKTRRNVEFDPSKCWGCGICVEACGSKAISMVPLDNGLNHNKK